VRAQNFGDASPYGAFMLKVGRRFSYREEQANNAQKMFAQELSVDGLRHSDWTCTLVLMMLDLHNLARHANPARNPIAIKELGAFMQAWIIGLGCIGRFFANELRPDAEGRWPRVGSAGFWGIVAGALSYLGALGLWIFTSVNVTDHAMLPANATQHQEWDSSVVAVITWTQVGYAVLAFGSVGYLNLFARDLRTGMWPMPGNQYDPRLSFIKDLFYGALDVTCKGGLALYCAMRATWVV
jgi:hypothetical protein